MGGFRGDRDRFPTRYALLIGTSVGSLKGQEPMDQGHKLERMQHRSAPATAGWWSPGDGIGGPGRQGQDTTVGMLYDIFAELAHPADVADRQRVATQGMYGILDRDCA